MIWFLVLVCYFGAALAAPSDLPPQTRSKEEVEAFKTFLQKAKPNNDSLEDAMARYPWASPWENSGKFQGDIVLRDEEIEGMVSEYVNPDMSRNAIRRQGGLWPNRVVVWDFQPGDFSAAEQNQIIQSLNFFNTRTCVRFRRRTNENTWVRVTGRQDGCYATVGHWNNYVHTFNLARGCFNQMIIIHEWIHVVGFWHMQQTYNRYDYVWINRQNMIAGTEFNFHRFSANEVDNLRLPYEYASNQHYGSHAFSRNGQPTIVARWAGGNQMGQMTHITGWDILRINRLYGCPGAWARSSAEPYYSDPEPEQPLEQEHVMEEEQEQVTEQRQVMEQE